MPAEVRPTPFTELLERRATTKNNENQSVCDRFSIVYLLYWNFLPRLGKLLNTRWNFELGDGDARFWSAPTLRRSFKDAKIGPVFDHVSRNEVAQRVSFHLFTKAQRTSRRSKPTKSPVRLEPRPLRTRASPEH